MHRYYIFFFLLYVLNLWHYGSFFLHEQRRYPCLLNAISTLKNGDFLEILNFLFKCFYILKNVEFRNSEIAVSSLCFSMFVVQIWCLYLVNPLLYGVLSERTFLTKTAEHDISSTPITFDLGWPRVFFFQRMRRIDARRGTEKFKTLFPTKFELLTKNHQGALCPPIRSRVKSEFSLTNFCTSPKGKGKNFQTDWRLNLLGPNLFLVNVSSFFAWNPGFYVVCIIIWWFWKNGSPHFVASEVDKYMAMGTCVVEILPCGAYISQ